MENNDITYVEKKYTIANIFASQHPVINCWIVLSAAALVALYAITYTTL